jgi:hypothetical protein
MLYGDLYLPVKNSLSYISQLFRGATECLLGLALAFLLPGCSSGDVRDAQVAWRLVDGRSCMDTAVVQVAKAAENQVMVKGVRVGARLRARAQSAQDAVLYRGELRIVEPIPAVIDLPMYYTGGE